MPALLREVHGPAGERRTMKVDEVDGKVDGKVDEV